MVENARDYYCFYDRIGRFSRVTPFGDVLDILSLVRWFLGRGLASVAPIVICERFVGLESHTGISPRLFRETPKQNPSYPRSSLANGLPDGDPKHRHTPGSFGSPALAPVVIS